MENILVISEKIIIHMILSEERIHRVLMETLDDTVKEFEKINSRHPLTPWNPATKMERMKPGNAARSKGTIPSKDFRIHSYDDWKANYKPQGISWEEYKNMEI